jgi:hypothetical protein
MKFTKILGLVAMAALALMAFASTASATTIELKGVKQTGAVKISASLKSGTSAVLKDTSGTFANTCNASTVVGEDTTSKTGTKVSGPISSLTFGPTCTHEKVVVHKAGSLEADWIKGTTNATMYSTGAEVTVPATIPFIGLTTVTCITNETDIGTATGVASGQATIHINAVLNCGSLLPSAKWEGTYVVTSPEGLGFVE